MITVDKDRATREPSYKPGYEEVAERIAAFIREANLQPGDRLPTELTLAQQFGVGRSSVREAVKVLAVSGLVRAKRGSGLYVGQNMPLVTAVVDLSMPVDLDHVLKLFEYRRLIETHAAHLASQRITPRELRALEAALGHNRAGAEADDIETFLHGDAAFHRTIADATQNPFITSTVDTIFRLQLSTVDVVLGLPGSMLRSAKQHAAIFEGVASGEPDAATSAMQTHLDTVARDFQQEVSRRLGLSKPSD